MTKQQAAELIVAVLAQWDSPWAEREGTRDHLRFILSRVDEMKASMPIDKAADAAKAVWIQRVMENAQ